MGIVKTNKNLILELIQKEKDNFENLKFNEKIFTFNQNDFNNLCNYYLENNKKYKLLKKEVEIKKNNNTFISWCNNEINKILRKHPNLAEEVQVFKSCFQTFEQLEQNFEMSLNRAKAYENIANQMNISIELFNEKQQADKEVKRFFNINKMFSDNLEEEIFEVERVKRYITVFNILSEFYKGKHYLPVLDNESELKNILILYKITNYNNFIFEKFNDYLLYENTINEQKKANFSFLEYCESIRKELNNFKMKINMNLILGNIVKYNYKTLTITYAEILNAYKKRTLKYEEVSNNLLGLERTLKNELDSYNKLMSVLDNVLKTLKIQKKEEIDDINDYFLYSVSKNIERVRNIYGTSKEINNQELNFVITLVEQRLYKLTNDQLNAIVRSIGFLNETYPASCLIQGDVSSGKTIVTVVLMFIMALKKKKSIYIVPRLILRQQHLKTLQKYNKLFELGLKIYDINEDFSIEEADIVLSGYSMTNFKLNTVEFELGIIDEIQLFGVEQRNQVQKKYPNIDMFYTTATPHPRTKLISLIGNMDIVEIKELPPGRKLKNTFIFEKMNIEIIQRVREEVAKENSVLVVCPLVNSEGIGEFENVRSAHNRYSEIFYELNVGLMLSSYSNERKDNIIQDVINRKINILVTTKIIEVGVDIPNASTIIIHYPYKQRIKWGVSQLHQMRGRVGRNNQDAYCYIQSNGTPPKGSPIDSVLKTQDVFELTKNDFNWRGFHNIIGTKQSGGNSQKLLVQKAKAYEMIAKETPNLIGQLDKKFIYNLEKAISEKRIENLN